MSAAWTVRTGHVGTRVSSEAPAAGVGIGAAPLEGGPELEVSCTCVCPSLLWGLVDFSLVPRLDVPGEVVQGTAPIPPTLGCPVVCWGALTPVWGGPMVLGCGLGSLGRGLASADGGGHPTTGAWKTNVSELPLAVESFPRKRPGREAAADGRVSGGGDAPLKG